eukprot:2009436-Amphidinium_carterae.1
MQRTCSLCSLSLLKQFLACELLACALLELYDVVGCSNSFKVNPKGESLGETVRSFGLGDTLVVDWEGALEASVLILVLVPCPCRSQVSERMKIPRHGRQHSCHCSCALVGSPPSTRA